MARVGRDREVAGMEICAECDGEATGRDVFRCRNRHVSVRGLAPCRRVVHTKCYGADEAFYDTTLNGGSALYAKPGDAKPGWTCMTCRLQAILGRELDLDSNPTDVVLYESAIMYQVDTCNSIVDSTAKKYTQGGAAFTNWAEAFAPTATFKERDEPKEPPVEDRPLLFGCHMEYTTSKRYTRGRRSGGGGVTAGTALGRVPGYKHLGASDGDITRELRSSEEFRRLQRGIKNRVLDNPVPMMMMAWETFCRWTRDLEQAWWRLRRRIREWRREEGEEVGRGERRRRALLLSEVHVLGMLHLLHLMVFGYTRGSVPFKLRYLVWCRGLWTHSRCVRHGVRDPDGQPMPHQRVLRDFRTKTHTSSWYEGVLAAETASGHRILATSVSLKRALQAAGLTCGGLFFDQHGREYDLSRWQSEVLRPSLRRMRDAGEPALLGTTDAEFDRRWTSWSLRRLCETQFACSSATIPMCPRDLKIGHSGWAEEHAQRGHISDRYRNWPLATKIDATRLFV